MTIVITGANRGIGAALLASYRMRGDDVIGTTRRAGVGAEGLHILDVRDPVSISVFAQDMRDKRINLLICNAGVYLDKGMQLTADYPPEDWAASFETNVTGVFLTIQALLPNLKQSSHPRIAIMSSIMASQARAPGGSYIYRASKAAVLNLGRNLARDLKSDGITVGIYHPGWVQTDMGGHAAEITVEQSAAGLLERFDTLTLESSGSFLGWDGNPIPF